MYFKIILKILHRFFKKSLTGILKSSISVQKFEVVGHFERERVQTDLQTDTRHFVSALYYVDT